MKSILFILLGLLLGGAAVAMVVAVVLVILAHLHGEPTALPPELRRYHPPDEPWRV